MNKVQVSDIHSSATISVKANLIKRIGYFGSRSDFFVEFFPLVCDYYATAETPYWNYHISHLIDRTFVSFGEHHVQVDALVLFFLGH